MSKRGKLYHARLETIEAGKVYTASEAVGLLQAMPKPNFDETVEAAYTLNIDPRHSGQTVRGMIVLPQGTGKPVTVAVVATGDPATQAEEAGADEVGGDDLIDRIKNGWLDFDVLIATPDTMKSLRPLGKTLGPRGLMPNPKTGTLTGDTAAAVKQAKAGRVEYRNDRNGCVHVPVGKASFSEEALLENVRAVHHAVVEAKPEGGKGAYIQGLSLCTTMSPGVKTDFRTLA